MALTKVKGSGVEGITNLSNATFLSVNASEVATLLTTAVINSEGGAVTTNIAQGLAKVWVVFDAPTTSSGQTITITDSFNMTSSTDNGTGQIMLVFANDMANDDYVINIQGGESNNLASVDTGTKATGQIRIETFNVSEALVNCPTCSVIFGDLA